MHDSRLRSTLARAAVALLAPCSLGLTAATATAAEPGGEPASIDAAYIPGEVIVKSAEGEPGVVELAEGTPVAKAVAELDRDPGVEYATPNWIAHAAIAPTDIGTAQTPGGWRADQWSFLGRPGGIRTVRAWGRLLKAGAPGGLGTTVAVVDTGIGIPVAGAHEGAPDFAAWQFVPGIDLVDDDAIPYDPNGHGTHVAATIGEQVTLGGPAPTNDYLTGIAYGAQLMAVRVLDAAGDGSAEDVAGGIVWAAQSGADVINLSLQFDETVTSCEQVRIVCDAIRTARRAGSVVIAAAGNALEGVGTRGALYPAAAPGAISVGASTESGCLATYSNYGDSVDLLAPGGGPPRPGAWRTECARDQRPVLQVSLACFPACGTNDARDYGIRPDTGTSMASAHASGVAALVIGSRVDGRNPKPRTVARRLVCGARSQKPRRFYSAGLLDAPQALKRKKPRCK
jgi:serine protease